MTKPIKAILAGAALCLLGAAGLDSGAMEATSCVLLSLGLFGMVSGVLSLPVE